MDKKDSHHTPKEDWSAIEIKTLFEQLRSRENGLSSQEAEEVYTTYGPNALPEQEQESLVAIFFRQFRSPLIYILIVVGILSIVLGKFSDSIIVIIVLLVNASIGAYQEGRSQNALQALKKYTETEALVLRDGKSVLVPSTHVVPGDIVIIQQGDKIPADARLIEAESLSVEQAALTGESRPIPKQTGLLKKDALTADQHNMVFKGTYVVAGSAKALVVATGSNTAIGKISRTIATIDTAEMPLKENLNNLSRIIIIAVLVMSVILFVIGIANGKDFQEMILTTMSLLVSVIPEGLPVIMVLILAQGVKRMSKQNVLVKRLQAVDALGQAKVLAVDKTGTLTRNELVAQEVYINNQVFGVHGIGYSSTGGFLLNKRSINPSDFPEIEYVGFLLSLSGNAKIFRDKTQGKTKIIGDPTEAAFLVLSEKLGYDKQELLKHHPLTDEIAFSHKTKQYINVHKVDGKYLLINTGAPEAILPLCNSEWSPDGKKRLSKKRKEEIQKTVLSMSKRGLRILMLAIKENVTAEVTEDIVEKLTFVGLVGMKDALRENAQEAIQKVQRAGMHVVMITGDHKETAQSIAREAGIYKTGDSILTGAEINEMNEKEFLEILTSVSVFARVTPEHKMKIIQGYRAKDMTIAMTGDGVNDVPSLVAAHLGVGMGKIGTEVTKEASDIILLDDNVGNIPDAVKEGRHIYSIIKKTLLYLFSTNIAELFLITAALVLNLPLPLLPAQILWLNLVTDGFLPLSLTAEPHEKNILKDNFVKPGVYIVDRSMVKRILLKSIIMTIGTLIMFVQYMHDDLAKATTIALTTMAAFQWFNIWNARTSTRSVFSLPLKSNMYLLYASVGVVILQIAAVHAPFMQHLLGTTDLTLMEWVTTVAVASSVLFIVEIRKLISRRILERE